MPLAELAVIEAEKIRDYYCRCPTLLVALRLLFSRRWVTVRTGGSGSRLTFASSTLSQKLMRSFESPHGRKYIIRANVKGPNDRTLAVQSIWIILKGEDFPRFVTAYPGEE